jgi:hypothetical protein
MDCPDYLTETRSHARLQPDRDKLALVQAAEPGFAAGGYTGMLRNMLKVQQKRYAQYRVTAYELAEAEALPGNNPAALQYLRLSAAQNEVTLAKLRICPYFCNLRPEPEFRRLVTDAGLPPLA